MTGIPIKDSSTGRLARVTPDFQLRTQAQDLPLQHFVSRDSGQAYSAIGEHTIDSTGTKTPLLITNDSATLTMVVTYMRLQVVNLTAGSGYNNPANYWQIGYGLTYASGGSAVTPTQLNTDTGNAADVTAYDDNPTVTGSITGVFDKYYPNNGDEQLYNKDGAVLIGARQSLGFQFVTDGTGGLIKVRCTFLMMDLRE